MRVSRARAAGDAVDRAAVGVTRTAHSRVGRRQTNRETPKHSIISLICRRSLPLIPMSNVLAKCPFPVSLHPHGLRYTRQFEGAFVNDGGRTNRTSGGHYVETNQEFQYEWDATVESGPSVEGLSTKFWAYHSHTHELHHHAGLFGPLIVGDPAKCDHQTMLPLDVDSEQVFVFNRVPICSNLKNSR
jgi:hypothetical protein